MLQSFSFHSLTHTHDMFESNWLQSCAFICFKKNFISKFHYRKTLGQPVCVCVIPLFVFILSAYIISIEASTLSSFDYYYYYSHLSHVDVIKFDGVLIIITCILVRSFVCLLAQPLPSTFIMRYEWCTNIRKYLVTCSTAVAAAAAAATATSTAMFVIGVLFSYLYIYHINGVCAVFLSSMWRQLCLCVCVCI